MTLTGTQVFELLAILFLYGLVVGLASALAAILMLGHQVRADIRAEKAGDLGE